MIQHIVDFALRQRLVIFAAVLALVVLGVQAYVAVPIEAYPDVGDTQVQVITQWPGHAAEELERQITLPIERELNTAPHQNSVRSVSIAGLSVVTVTLPSSSAAWGSRRPSRTMPTSARSTRRPRSWPGPSRRPSARGWRWR